MSYELGGRKILDNQMEAWFFIVLLGSFTLWFFWPGILRPDSLGQYSQALTGSFTDHHPPMMAAVWRFLNKLYPGSGLMLTLHMILLWSASLFFVRAVKNTAWVWFFVLLPLWPQVLSFAPFILKDGGFALSFLCVSAILSPYTIQRQSMSVATFICCLALLFYGTAVKYQGLFILPLISVWLGYVLARGQLRPALKYGGVIFAFLALSVSAFNEIVTQQKSHAWQYVKLYDLAAISLAQQQPYFPDFVVKDPAFSMESLAQKFNPRRVDELVWGDKVPVRAGRDEVEREALLNYWWRTISAHPIDYLKHRIRLFSYLVQGSTFKSMKDILGFHQGIPIKVQHVIYQLDSIGLGKIVSTLNTFQWYLPLLVFYVGFGLYRFKSSPYTPVLFFMNAMALLLLLVLFVFSMASDIRYIYLSLCCFHFSHPFFFLSCKRNS